MLCCKKSNTLYLYFSLEIVGQLKIVGKLLVPPSIAPNARRHFTGRFRGRLN